MARRLELGEYCGRAVRRRRVRGFVITENRFRPGLEIERHSHAHPHFTFVLAGGFTERYGDRILECRPDSTLLVPADEAHTDQVWNEGAHSLGVEIAPDVATRLARQTEVLRKAKVVVHDPIRAASHRLFREFFSQDVAAELCIESLALEILVLAARIPKPTNSAEPRWMREVVERLRDGFSESLSLESLADTAGVHVTHLARTFRRTHGCTVGDYVRRLRIEAGARDLRITDKPVAQVAMDAGFCDQSHFCRSFRRVYGVTPSEYRADRGNRPKSRFPC
ncbi:helix-turn-helix transcriptional regulator [Fimbriimonas ginsengisoli]|uniref:Transcriptional regulator, AraC family n=1 Tax=Fimbriimonas ginsengisoli Gsoil 348 TaxID=661478 RepID=A0A068NPL8_FIMGI|nr:AraC family transcriptional regulator [Fimbriimonas ginsengisoli]AIE85391.1 Transcriptional regulator, AraC family [Fimbriimonas ginsengisoli Gsoil 348]